MTVRSIAVKWQRQLERITDKSRNCVSQIDKLGGGQNARTPTFFSASRQYNR
jgi:hypothetical protein